MKRRRYPPFWPLYAAMLLGVLGAFVLVACNPGEGGNATSSVRP